MRTHGIWLPTALVVALGAAARLSTPAAGQAPSHTPKAGTPGPSHMSTNFTFVPKADAEALMKGTSGDRPARVMNIAHGANLGAFILHLEQRKGAQPARSFYHSEVSELYYVIRGEGTALLGGELENPTWDDPNSDGIKQVRGPSVNGTMKSPRSQKWSPGDIIMVSAGVPHSIGWDITTTADILRVAVDPKRSLQIK
jgi:mannose-6-phosphate isomerase-like protein (cupin superfamily)